MGSSRDRGAQTLDQRPRRRRLCAAALAAAATWFVGQGSAVALAPVLHWPLIGAVRLEGSHDLYYAVQPGHPAVAMLTETLEAHPVDPGLLQGLVIAADFQVKGFVQADLYAGLAWRSLYVTPGMRFRPTQEPLYYVDVAWPW